MSAETEPRRVDLPKRQACFHCSKVLSNRTKKPGTYIGFALPVEGIDRIFHKACIADFVAGVLPVEMEEIE